MIVMIIYLSSQLQKGNVHKFINLHCVFIAVVQIEAGIVSKVINSVLYDEVTVTWLKPLQQNAFFRI